MGNELMLPPIVQSSSSNLDVLTKALNVPREVLASDEEIQHAWNELPRLLNKIPPAKRDTLLVRMCVAVASGLLDSAVNYAWNAAVIELREKVRKFGIHIVPQVITGDFSESKLNDLQDAALLDLCLRLNLVSEDGYFLLGQCREIRNNFSAAHPPLGAVDDHEFISFLNRCAKYALAASEDPKGVDVQEFLKAVKGGKFASSQKQEWVQRIGGTHEAQRETLFSTLHGIYCDPSSDQEARLNSLAIVEEFKSKLTTKAKSALIDRHSEYMAQAKVDRHTASLDFFSKLGLLELLSTAERHMLISGGCKKLMAVHHAFDNFYNEPPFAERLLELTLHTAVPDTVREEYVESVMTCAVGNPYGVSNAAYPSYEKMIQNFSPKEIDALFTVLSTNNTLRYRVGVSNNCKKSLKLAMALIDPASIPVKHKVAYETVMTS